MTKQLVCKSCGCTYPARSLFDPNPHVCLECAGDPPVVTAGTEEKEETK